MQLRSETTEHPFQVVKLISWSFFVLILGSTLVLSVFLADYARRTLIEKQEDFALLLAENLNHQIYVRFTRPMLFGFGRVELKRPEQYEQLERVITSTIHSFHVQSLRIYDIDKVVSFSMDKKNVGNKTMAGPAVETALEEGTSSYEIISRYPDWEAFIKYALPQESVILKITYPLRAEERLGPGGQHGPIMGVLELSQDITADYRKVINFERMIIFATLFSSLALFFVLMMIMRRAERVTAERAAERKKLERKLSQSEKMATMGRMVSGVAHEIRNPLGIIRSSAELLLQKAKAAESPNTPLLQAIFDESKRLSRTVNDFLDYARPKEARRDSVELSAIFDQVAVFLEPRSRELGITIHRNYAPGIFVPGDKDLIYRAVYNLVANAQDAIGGAGEIHLGLDVLNGTAKLLISDTGPGFDEDVVAQVTDPFFTTKDNGTGLGLTIVANIVEAHGGTLDIRNRDGGGACIELRLPVNT